MRKKLDTRFPAARIKKIMQVDEEVGKIALSTPLLVSKALELFLQDLLDRTYDVMTKRGGKTLNSGHLKQCLEQFREYDFLKDLAATMTDAAPETPRSGPSLDGPGSSSMGRGRRPKVDVDEHEAEGSGDCGSKAGNEWTQSSLRRKPSKTNRDDSEQAQPGASLTNIGLKRQLSSAPTHTTDAVELQPPVPDVKRLKEEKFAEAAPAANGPKGFSLGFDLNSCPDMEETVVEPPRIEVPVIAAVQVKADACGSDDDYDAE